MTKEKLFENVSRPDFHECYISEVLERIEYDSRYFEPSYIYVPMFSGALTVTGYDEIPYTWGGFSSGGYYERYRNFEDYIKKSFGEFSEKFIANLGGKDVVDEISKMRTGVFGNPGKAYVSNQDIVIVAEIGKEIKTLNAVDRNYMIYFPHGLVLGTHEPSWDPFKIKPAHVSGNYYPTILFLRKDIILEDGAVIRKSPGDPYDPLN